MASKEANELRQTKVLGFKLEGRTDAWIARELGVSPRTVVRDWAACREQVGQILQLSPEEQADDVAGYLLRLEHNEELALQIMQEARTDKSSDHGPDYKAMAQLIRERREAILGAADMKRKLGIHVEAAKRVELSGGLNVQGLDGEALEEELANIGDELGQLAAMRKKASSKRKKKAASKRKKAAGKRKKTTSKRGKKA